MLRNLKFVCVLHLTLHCENVLAVEPLQVQVGELKGRLTEVISNCDALCKRIATEGPEALQSSVKPFVANDMEPLQLKSLQRVLTSKPST